MDTPNVPVARKTTTTTTTITRRKQVKDNTQRSYAEEIIPLAVYDSRVTSSCVMNNDEYILTDEQSNKVFCIPTGTTTKESAKSKMHHNLRYI